ncbi:MAG TPA: hypothetical protein VF872_04040 [Gaiellaceae bacterium]
MAGRPSRSGRRARDGRHRLAVLRLDDVDLTAVDRGGELVAGKRQRPLAEAEVTDPHGCLVEQPGDGHGVFLMGAADVHKTSIASPNE